MNNILVDAVTKLMDCNSRRSTGSVQDIRSGNSLYYVSTQSSGGTMIQYTHSPKDKVWSIEIKRGSRKIWYGQF